MKKKQKILSAVFYFCVFVVSAVEICNNGIDDDGDGLIDCYDPECRGDVSCDDFFIRDTVLGDQTVINCSDINDIFNLKIVWNKSGNGTDIQKTTMVGDINNDGVPDVLTRYLDVNGPYNYFCLINGVTGVPVNIPAAQYLNDPFAIADIDLDGYGEIVAFCNDTVGGILQGLGMVVFEHDGSKKWYNTTLSTSLSGNYPALADFDGDGTPEIYIGNVIIDALTGNLIAEGTGSVGKPAWMGSGYSKFSIAADVLPDTYCAACAGLELVCGNQVYAVDIAGNSVAVVSTAPSGLADGYTAVADFDGDNLLDIIVNMGGVFSGSSPRVYVWDPRKSSQIGTTYTLNGAQTGGIPNVADVDGDNRAEIGIATERNYYVIDNNMSLLWLAPITDNTTTLTPSSTMFDFDCDGILEIVYRDGVALKIFDGATGAIKGSYPCSSGTSYEKPVVADVDNDGHAEIICGCDQTGITMFENVINSWPPARKVSNQYSYYVVNINDDLTVPRNQQYHSNNLLPRQLNSFLNQTPIFDSILVAECIKILVLDDFTVSIDSIKYITCDSVRVTLKVCNITEGSGVDPLMSITLYEEDPLQNGTVIQTETLYSSIPGNDCRYFNLSFQFNHSFSLFVYVNDDGSNPLSAPTILLEECDTTNNADSTLIKYTDPVNLLVTKDTVICSGDSIVLQVSGATDYLWSKSSSSGTIISTDSFLIVSPFITTTYLIEGSNVCDIKNEMIQVTAKNCEIIYSGIYSPAAFTPNSDGLNDVFYVQSGVGMSTFDITIFDRWGNEIFKSNNIKEGWDGKYKDNLLQQDVYTYQVNYTTIYNDKGSLIGRLALIK